MYNAKFHQTGSHYFVYRRNEEASLREMLKSMSELFALGLNYVTAPIQIREKCAFSDEQLQVLLKDLQHKQGPLGLVVVATCNRTEIYFQKTSYFRVLRLLRRHLDHMLDVFRPYTYTFENQFAVRHLMRVASGLDSMVLGEVEILGQLKAAYQTALSIGTIDQALSRLFQHTFQVAKIVRSRTAIGINPVSIAYAAVQLSKYIFTDVTKTSAIVVGAGETARLVLLHLAGRGVKKVCLYNRSLTKATLLRKTLEDKFEHFEVKPLSQLTDNLYKADIVISATASPLPLIGKGIVEKSLKLRKQKPIYLVDLGVPRDIEQEVGNLDDAYLYNVDDLKDIVKENRASREHAAKQAELIIDKEVTVFMKWLKERDSIDMVKELRESFHEKKSEVLLKYLKFLDKDKPANKVLEEMANSLINKLLHQPTLAIREATSQDDEVLLEKIKLLFNLGK